MTLPQTVSPGDLITADLFNAILEALRDFQSIDERFGKLAQEITDLKAQVNRIEELLNKFNANGNELRGRVDHLYIDRDKILARLDDLNVTVIPSFRKRFDDIEADIVKRFEPIEKRVTEVELQIVRIDDPIEKLPGLKPENISELHSHGIYTVEELKAHSAEIGGIIGNDIEAQQITIMIGKIGAGRIG